MNAASADKRTNDEIRHDLYLEICLLSEEKREIALQEIRKIVQECGNDELSTPNKSAEI
ncbi:hypothetical protein [Aurantivibrio infirmus]